MTSSGCSYCLPIFFHSHFLVEGHTCTSENATVTFVEFQGKVYAVTCKHVLDSLQSRKNEQKDHWYSLTLHVGKVIINMSCFDPSNPDKKIDTFRVLHENFGDEEVDIVISPIDSYWDLIQKEKGKRAINLDKWNTPEWNKMKMGTAYGYPTEHKSVIENKIAAECIEASAEIASNLNNDSTTITISSALENSHGYYFSGISGGVIAVSGENTWEPVAITYEGLPGSSETFAKSSSSAESFITDKDILIKGVMFNQNIFSRWLYRAGLIK